MNIHKEKIALLIGKTIKSVQIEGNGNDKLYLTFACKRLKKPFKLMVHSDDRSAISVLNLKQFEKLAGKIIDITTFESCGAAGYDDDDDTLSGYQDFECTFKTKEKNYKLKIRCDFCTCCGLSDLEFYPANYTAPEAVLEEYKEVSVNVKISGGGFGNCAPV